MPKPMKDYKLNLREKQIRAEEYKKTAAMIALKLCPPFTKTWFANEILGVSKFVLDNWIRKYIKEESK